MRRLLGTVGTVLALGLLATPMASAVEQEVGDGCIGDDVKTGSSALLLSNGPEGAPYQRRVIEPSVITSWRVQVGPGIKPLPQRLLVLSQVEPESERKIAESALETVGPGSNEFATRIPVPGNTWVGLGGPSGGLFCQDAPLHIVGFVEDPFELGEARKPDEISGSGVPVVVKVEEDRDGDGYGDKTQDQCSSLAFLQTPCPIRLAVSAKATRAAILLTVSTGPPARVYVSGKVAWSFKPKGGGLHKSLAAGLNAPNQEVGYEATATFRVPLRKAVKRRLSQLPARRSLRARLYVEAINPAGDPPSHQSLVVDLPGRKKPGRKQRASPHFAVICAARCESDDPPSLLPCAGRQSACA